MTARGHKLSLGDSADIPNRNAVDVSPTSPVLGTVSLILASLKGEMIDNEDSVDSAEYCFKVCEGLKEAIQGRSAGDPNESEKVAIEGLERVMDEIERTPGNGASSSHAKHIKEQVENHMLEVRRILGALDALGPSPNENLSACGHDPNLKPVGPHGIAISSASETACRRLIRHASAPREHLPSSLIETILSSKDKDEMIRRIPVDDVQVFVDAMDKTLNTSDLPPLIRKKCLRLLYRTCGYHALLPSVLIVSAHYDRTRSSPCRGGYADVWRGECRGRDVAIKVIRTYSNRELQKMINRFCKEVVTWRFLRHPNVLPLVGVMMSENEFAMISDWMTNGDINEFIERHPDVDRLGLLAGVARGLIYLHTNGMVHGDLKGANVLVDRAGNARLADFGLLTIISDPANRLSSSSNTQGGTVRWMGPELITPERFGSEKGRPTKSSDCYALGMVIYETVGGRVPFYEHADLTVFMKVMKGEHPTRGVKFTEDLWRMLELCWDFQPDARPSIEDILLCLEISSDSSEPPSSGSSGEMEMDGEDWDSSDGDSVQDWTSATIETEGNTSTSPGWIHVANGGICPVSSVSRPALAAATYGADVNNPDCEGDTDPFTILNVIEEVERPTSNVRNSNLYRNSDTEGPHRPLQGSGASLGHSSNPNPVHITNGGSRYFAIHPILDRVTESRPHETVKDSPVEVPEYPYRCSTIQRGWKKEPSIYFSTRFGPGVRLLDALNGNLDGVDDKDGFPFGARCSEITIRIRFPGYASSTAVERRLDEQRERDGRSVAGSMQVSISSCERRVLPGSITKRELVKQVSKCIRRYIRDLEEDRDLFPFDGGVSERWRLGQGRMKLKHMVITRLDNVCPGCWSPIIYIE